MSDAPSYNEFFIGNGSIAQRKITRQDNGVLNVLPNTEITIPVGQILAFAEWIRMPRPLMPGDFVTFKTGRYAKDAGEVLAVIDNKVWLRVVWDTSTEDAIQDISYIDGRITPEQAEKLGFRMELSHFHKGGD